ncbi:hypothetical protein ILYODFUR_036413 [Ilyodon furcidens]|uniref:Pyrin domain-containing protein n=1 Tax=Ilyodon furcidens TaxID=33524 RepID=A0ABV0VK29_9TELE
MMTPEDLLNVLEDLGEEEFIKFKWLLQQTSNPLGFPAIRKSRLQTANRQDTVDLMVQTYSLSGTVKVIKKVLEKISRNDLLQIFCASSSGSEVDASDVGRTSVNTGHLVSLLQAPLPQIQSEVHGFIGM